MRLHRPSTREVRRYGRCAYIGPPDEDNTDYVTFGNPAHMQDSTNLTLPITIVSWQTWQGSSSGDDIFGFAKQTTLGVRAWVRPSATYAPGCLIWTGTVGSSRSYALASAMPLPWSADGDNIEPFFMAARLPEQSQADTDAQLFFGNLWRRPKQPSSYVQQFKPSDGDNLRSNGYTSDLTIGCMQSPPAYIYSSRQVMFGHAMWNRYLDDGEIFRLWKNYRPDTVPGCIWFAVPYGGGWIDLVHGLEGTHTQAYPATSDATYGLKHPWHRAVVEDRILVRRRTYSYRRPVSATLGGTVTASIDEQDVRDGGKTVTLTLAGDTWIPS